MAKIDLGRVVGENGGFGNVRSTYISDGGMPSVGIEASGPDTAKDFDFIFSNIVNDPMTDEEIDGIVDGQYSQSSDVLNGRGLSRLWNWICELFAPKEHKHSASDLDSGTIDAARIANGTITKDMLDKTLGDSLSHVSCIKSSGSAINSWIELEDTSNRMLIISDTQLKVRGTDGVTRGVNLA